MSTARIGTGVRSNSQLRDHNGAERHYGDGVQKATRSCACALGHPEVGCTLRYRGKVGTPLHANGYPEQTNPQRLTACRTLRWPDCTFSRKPRGEVQTVVGSPIDAVPGDKRPRGDPVVSIPTHPKNPCSREG